MGWLGVSVCTVPRFQSPWIKTSMTLRPTHIHGKHASCTELVGFTRHGACRPQPQCTRSREASRHHIHTNNKVLTTSGINIKTESTTHHRPGNSYHYCVFADLIASCVRVRARVSVCCVLCVFRVLGRSCSRLCCVRSVLCILVSQSILQWW